jgi:hypothetical protein
MHLVMVALVCVAGIAHPAFRDDVRGGLFIIDLSHFMSSTNHNARESNFCDSHFDKRNHEAA